jgi:hypothetical protein
MLYCFNEVIALLRFHHILIISQQSWYRGVTFNICNYDSHNIHIKVIHKMLYNVTCFTSLLCRTSLKWKHLIAWIRIEVFELTNDKGGFCRLVLRFIIFFSNNDTFHVKWLYWMYLFIKCIYNIIRSY